MQKSTSTTAAAPASGAAAAAVPEPGRQLFKVNLEVCAPAQSINGCIFVALIEGHRIAFCDATTLDIVKGRIYHGHTQPVTCLTTFRDASGKLVLVSGSEDKTIRLWNVETCAVLGTLSHAEPIKMCTICTKKSNNEVIIVSVTNNGAIYYWNANTGTQIGGVLDALHANGTRHCIAYEDSSGQVFSLTAGMLGGALFRVEAETPGHQQRPHVIGIVNPGPHPAGLSFCGIYRREHPDPACQLVLVTTCSKGTICFWHAEGNPVMPGGQPVVAIAYQNVLLYEDPIMPHLLFGDTRFVIGNGATLMQGIQNSLIVGNDPKGHRGVIAKHGAALEPALANQVSDAAAAVMNEFASGGAAVPQPGARVLTINEITCGTIAQDKSGNTLILIGDAVGRMFLINGQTFKVIFAAKPAQAYRLKSCHLIFNTETKQLILLGVDAKNIKLTTPFPLELLEKLIK